MKTNIKDVLLYFSLKYDGVFKDEFNALAENEEITRQSVRDNLKKGENKLFEYEKKLGIMKKTVESQEKIAEVLSEITTIETKMTDKEIAEVLEDVKNKLSVLI